MGRFAAFKGALLCAYALYALPTWAQEGRGLCASQQVLSFIEHVAGPQDVACERVAKRVLDRMEEVLTQGGVVLLGEVHDNAHHHALRGHLIDLLRARQVRSALVFEHVAMDRQASLDAIAGRSTKEFFDLLQWDQSGWPERFRFEPLILAALRSQWLLVAASPTRQEVRAALAASAPDSLGAPLPAPMMDSLLEELEQSHCGLLPRSAFGPMARAQQLRDRRMAEQMLAARVRAGSAMLVAGNGHIRRDRGVPFQLASLAPALPGVLSVAFEEQHTPSRLHTPADWTVVTSGVARADPCVQMRQQFGKPAP